MKIEKVEYFIIKNYVFICWIFLLFTIIMNSCTQEQIDTGARISTLDCANPIYINQPVSGYSYNEIIKLNYTGGNGLPYTYSFSTSSYGVGGLIATLQTGTLNNGDGQLSFQVMGTPQKDTTGYAYFSVSFNGYNCVCSIYVSNVVPTKVLLSLPLNNAPCVPANNGLLNFQWDTSVNTVRYKIYVTNLNDTNLKYIDSSSQNFMNLNLPLSQPYQWYIVSYNSRNDSAVSAKFRFYLTGTPGQNYAPFPATLISPINLVQINNPISFQWQGTDPDGDTDIDHYDIYIDNNQFRKGISTNGLTIPSVITGLHRWYIITVDKSGNQSKSNSGSFLVL
ncbi:MAG: hypothetical protein ORN85_07605 [Sediminibacterium sp.]|nr:hypothetical protein [Sediminibacterium sp.]